MKMFHKVLALVLTVLLLVTALPVSVIADAWLEVEAETNGSSSSVKITVDGEVLADLLETHGVSKDLLDALREQKAIDKEALKQMFTMQELLEIIPKESLLEIFNLKEIVAEIGLDVLSQYLDLPALLQKLDTAKLVDLVKDIPDLDQYVDVEALLVEKYISTALILAHLDEDALFAGLDVNVLKSELLLLSMDQIKQIVNVNAVVKDELLDLNAIVDFAAVKAKLEKMTDADLLSYISDKDALSDQVKSKLSTLSGSVLKGYIKDTSKIEAALVDMNTSDLRGYISNMTLLSEKLGAKFDAMSTAVLRSYITNESLLADDLLPKLVVMDTDTLLSYASDRALLGEKMDAKFMVMTDADTMIHYITDVVKAEQYMESKYSVAELLPYVKGTSLDFKALVDDDMLTAHELLEIDVVNVHLLLEEGVVTVSEFLEWDVVNLSALFEDGVFTAEELMDWNIINLEKLVADGVITAENLLDWNVVDFAALVNDKIDAADLLGCADLGKVVEDSLVTVSELLSWDVVNLGKLVDDGVIVLNMDAVKTELNKVDAAKLKDSKYSDLDKALDVLGVEKCVQMVGGYGKAKQYIDIEGLIAELDLKGLVDKILANGKKLDDYIDFESLLLKLEIADLLEVIPLSTALEQLDEDEIAALLEIIDIESYIQPVLTLAYNKLMLNIDQITINDFTIAQEDPTTTVLKLDPATLVRAILDVIPTVDEFTTMTDGKILSFNLGLVYTVDGTTTQKTKNISFEFVVEGDLTRVQNAVLRLEELIKRYVNKLEYANGLLTLDIRVPGAAARLFARVLDSEELPDELKQKILNIPNVKGDGSSLALLDALTFEEILTILDIVEPSKLYEAFKNISYVQVVFEKIQNKTGYNLSQFTLDELVDYAANIPSFERLSEIIANKTEKDVLALVYQVAGKVDEVVDRTEKIAMVEKILNKVAEKINIDLREVSATELVDRAKDNPISEMIAKEIAERVNVDVLTAMRNYSADELYELALKKAADHEDKYNKVKGYIQTVAAYLPDELLTKSISDAYRGNGVFGGKGSVTFNAKKLVEKVIAKINERIELPEKAINFLMENIDAGEVTLKLDATVRLTDIYQITYMNREGTEELYKVFLPVGADLSVFKYNADISGYEFTGWADENGVEILTMPAADTVVYADRSVIYVNFEDADGTFLGMIPMQSGDTLSKHADKVAQFAGLVKLPEFNAHIEEYSVAWFDAALEQTIDSTTQITADTTLTATPVHSYHFNFDIELPFDVAESNGVYTLTVHDELPDFFELNLANDVFLKRASGSDNVTLNVVIGQNGGYNFLTITDATLTQIYNPEGGEVVFDYSKLDAMPDSFKDSIYEKDSNALYYSFDIFSNGTKVGDLFAEPIRIRVPAATAVVNAAGTKLQVVTIKDGIAEELETEVPAQGYVQFSAPHFSDFAIGTKYLVKVEFKDGNSFVDGSMIGIDPAGTYFTAYSTLVLQIENLDAAYKFDKIEVLGTTYNLGDTIEVTAPMTITVFVSKIATTVGYNVYYYVNGALKYTQPYTAADVATFALKPFDEVTAGVTPPAGYKETGAWVGFDQSLLGFSDIYVSAKWDLIPYTVVFKGPTDAQDVTFQNVTVENYASTVVEPALPEKAGEYATKWEDYDLTQLAQKADANNVYTIEVEEYKKLFYNIVITDDKVTSDAAGNSATMGQTVTITATPEDGYLVNEIIVKTAGGVDVAVTDGKFTMPAEAVTVTVTYKKMPLSYTINGDAFPGEYGDDITFSVTLSAGEVWIQTPTNASLVSITTNGAERTYLYTFRLVEDGIAIEYSTANAVLSVFKIFNGTLFQGSGDPVSTDKNVTFNSWSAAVAGMFSFATFTTTFTQSLLWLWILLAVLVLIAIIAVLYALYINGKIRRPLFLLRFVAWLVGLFFALCLAVSGLFLKVLHLFGKSDDPEDYGFDKVPAEDEKAVEDTAEAATEETATEEAATEEAATEDAATEDAATEDAATEEAATEDAATEEAATEDAATEETATEDVADEATTEDATAETAEETPEDGSSDEDTPADGKPKTE